MLNRSKSLMKWKTLLKKAVGRRKFKFDATVEKHKRINVVTNVLKRERLNFGKMVLGKVVDQMRFCLLLFLIRHYKLCKFFSSLFPVPSFFFAYANTDENLQCFTYFEVGCRQFDTCHGNSSVLSIVLPWGCHFVSDQNKNLWLITHWSHF